MTAARSLSTEAPLRAPLPSSCVVRRGHRHETVASLALGLESIASSPVAIEVRAGLQHPAATAELVRDQAASTDTVAKVLDVGVPPKILNAVVCLRGVRVVAGLHPRRTRTNERLKDKSVHKSCDHPTAEVELDREISACIDANRERPRLGPCAGQPVVATLLLHGENHPAVRREIPGIGRNLAKSGHGATLPHSRYGGEAIWFSPGTRRA